MKSMMAAATASGCSLSARRNHISTRVEELRIDLILWGEEGPLRSSKALDLAARVVEALGECGGRIWT